MDRVVGEVIFTDYPDKYAKKVDWWKTDSGLSLIRNWRCSGKTIEETAKLMGIDVRTLRSWRKKYPEFDEAIMDGKDVADSNVVHSLYKRALGYDYWEETWELVEGEMILTRKFKKHMPPDVKAILHYLFNRLPNQWRAVQEPLEKTQYTETIQNILIAMKEVAENGESKSIEVKEEVSE